MAISVRPCSGSSPLRWLWPQTCCCCKLLQQLLQWQCDPLAKRPLRHKQGCYKTAGTALSGEVTHKRTTDRGTRLIQAKDECHVSTPNFIRTVESTVKCNCCLYVRSCEPGCKVQGVNLQITETKPVLQPDNTSWAGKQLSVQQME